MEMNHFVNNATMDLADVGQYAQGRELWFHIHFADFIEDFKSFLLEGFSRYDALLAVQWKYNLTDSEMRQLRDDIERIESCR